MWQLVYEIKKCIAILINMGTTPRNNVKEYLDTNPYQYIPFYQKTMTLKQFQLINSMLHLNSTPNPSRNCPGHDPWNKVRPYIDKLTQNFDAHFVPKQHICIDKKSYWYEKQNCIYIILAQQQTLSLRLEEVRSLCCDIETSYVLCSEIYSGAQFLLLVMIL